MECCLCLFALECCHYSTLQYITVHYSTQYINDNIPVLIGKDNIPFFTLLDQFRTILALLYQFSLLLALLDQLNFENTGFFCRKYSIVVA